MKIVEDGSLAWYCTIKCKQCGVELELNEKDLGYDSFKVSGMFYAGDAVCEPFFYFNCMVCHSDNTIKDEFIVQTIPNGLRGNLIRKYHQARH